MIDAFASYMPSRWFDEAGMSKPGHAQGAVRAKRDRRWKNSSKKMSMSVVAAAALAVASVLVSEVATASSHVDFAAPPGMSAVGRAAGPDASLGQINESFEELFSAFRDGVKLITNERTLKLAEKASLRRNERPDQGWARRLASDVGEAND